MLQQMTRWIVKGYQNRLVTNLRKLYERREANSEWGSPEHVMLRRARINAKQVEQGYKGDQLGLPTFLLGGAILSTIISTLRAFVIWALSGSRRNHRVHRRACCSCSPAWRGPR